MGNGDRQTKGSAKKLKRGGGRMKFTDSPKKKGKSRMPTIRGGAPKKGRMRKA